MSIHKERLTKRKHHWGRLGDIKLYKERIPEVNRPYNLVVECWSADDDKTPVSNPLQLSSYQV